MTASEEFAAVVYHARMHMHADLPSVGINHYYLSYLRFPKVRIRQQFFLVTFIKFNPKHTNSVSFGDKKAY